MCTSLVVNKRKTIVGWNLDLLDMTWRVRPSEAGVFMVYDLDTRIVYWCENQAWDEIRTVKLV